MSQKKFTFKVPKQKIRKPFADREQVVQDKKVYNRSKEKQSLLATLIVEEIN